MNCMLFNQKKLYIFGNLNVFFTWNFSAQHRIIKENIKQFFILSTNKKIRFKENLIPFNLVDL